MNKSISKIKKIKIKFIFLFCMSYSHTKPLRYRMIFHWIEMHRPGNNRWASFVKYNQLCKRARKNRQVASWCHWLVKSLWLTFSVQVLWSGYCNPIGWVYVMAFQVIHQATVISIRFARVKKNCHDRGSHYKQESQNST